MLAPPVGSQRGPLIERHLHVVAAGLRVIGDPVQHRCATDEVELLGREVKQDDVADHVAVGGARHELLGLVDLEVVEGVHAQPRQQGHRVRPLDGQLGHVERLVVEHAGVLPRPLLVAPVRVLGGNAGVHVRPDLRVAQHARPARRWSGAVLPGYVDSWLPPVDVDCRGGRRRRLRGRRRSRARPGARFPAGRRRSRGRTRAPRPGRRCRARAPCRGRSAASSGPDRRGRAGGGRAPRSPARRARRPARPDTRRGSPARARATPTSLRVPSGSSSGIASTAQSRSTSSRTCSGRRASVVSARGRQRRSRRPRGHRTGPCSATSSPARGGLADTPAAN